MASMIVLNCNLAWQASSPEQNWDSTSRTKHCRQFFPLYAMILDHILTVLLTEVQDGQNKLVLPAEMLP